jgi:hypothetical protein
MPINVLVFGSDPVLLDTRRWLLEKAGFSVWAVSTVSDAQERLVEHDIALVVFCSSARPEAAPSVVTAARSHNPNVKTLFVTQGSPIARPLGGEVIYSLAGPAVFVSCVRRLLGLQMNSPEQRFRSKGHPKNLPRKSNLSVGIRDRRMQCPNLPEA